MWECQNDKNLPVMDQMTVCMSEGLLIPDSAVPLSSIFQLIVLVSRPSTSQLWVYFSPLIASSVTTGKRKLVFFSGDGKTQKKLEEESMLDLHL